MSSEIDYPRETLRALAVHDADWFLQSLVMMANGPNVIIGVTLLVKGALVSGQIVGGAEYFKKLGKQFGIAVGMPEEEGAALFKSIIDKIYTKPEPEDEAEGDDDPSPGFIHLKNARVFQGTALVPTGQADVLWRGKLAEVDGFILGELSSPRS